MALRRRACSCPLNVGKVAAEEGDVAGGDAVGNTAEAVGILRAEDGAAGNGDAHAGIKGARSRNGIAEMGAGESILSNISAPRIRPLMSLSP